MKISCSHSYLRRSNLSPFTRSRGYCQCQNRSASRRQRKQAGPSKYSARATLICLYSHDCLEPGSEHALHHAHGWLNYSGSDPPETTAKFSDYCAKRGMISYIKSVMPAQPTPRHEDLLKKVTKVDLTSKPDVHWLQYVAHAHKDAYPGLLPLEAEKAMYHADVAFHSPAGPHQILLGLFFFGNICIWIAILELVPFLFCHWGTPTVACPSGNID